MRMYSKRFAYGGLYDPMHVPRPRLRGLLASIGLRPFPTYRTRFHRVRVGRSDFWEPLVNLLARKTPREAAVTEMGRRYREFVTIFEKAREAKQHTIIKLSA